jgi:hypothetical protein
MNVNVYLPDELGARAKEAELPFSQLLQGAVLQELERIATVQKTLTEPEVYELYLEDREGRSYKGRVTGALIAEIYEGPRHGVQAYLTADERVIIYDGEKQYFEVEDDDVEEALRGWLGNDPAAYTDACEALGIDAVIDL